MNFGKINQYMLFGGGRLLAEVSLKLLKKGFKVLVVTSKRHLQEYVTDSTSIPLKEFLTNNNIDFIVSKNVNTDSNVINKIRKYTLGLSMGAAWIFRGEFIKYFEGKLFNFHGTRLPQDRGGGGFSWMIMRGERLGFVLIHQVNIGVDTGKIIKYKEFFFPYSCRLHSDYDAHQVKQCHILIDEFIKEIKAGKEFNTIDQPEYLSTYWPRLSTDIHGYIDWNWKLEEISQFICAFDDPYKGAITFVKGMKVRLKKCLSTKNDGVFHPFQNGLVYRITAGALFVAAGEGSLIIESIKDDFDINIIDKIKVGDRFYTPVKYLEEAKQYRAVYNAEGLKNGNNFIG